jgi:hypothetical protein
MSTYPIEGTLVTHVCTRHNARVRNGQLRYAGEGQWYMAQEQASCPEGLGGCRNEWRIAVITEA